MSTGSPYPDLSHVRRVLVTKLRHHGDVLLAGPVLSALRHSFPKAEIDALIYRDTRPMLDGHPDLTRLHVIGRKSGLGEGWRLLQSLRPLGYDLLVHLSSNPRGAWLARLLQPAVSVAPDYPGRLYRNSFTHLYKSVYGHRRHTVENNLDALRRIGLVVREADKPLKLAPGAEAEAMVQDELQRLGLTPGAFILMHPTSRWLFKCWPEELVSALADQLAGEGHRILFSAGPDTKEMAMVERIRGAMVQPSASLAGRLNLSQMGALIAHARLLIGVDSAPMHMAAAVGTPVAAVFGPSSEIDWGPWRSPARVITSPHPCRPCGLDGCGGGKRSECLDQIPVAQVLRAVRELLEVPR